MGTDKLYRLNDGQFVANVDYKLFHDPAATNWWAELILIDYVPLSEGDMFMIELENKKEETQLSSRGNTITQSLNENKC